MKEPLLYLCHRIPFPPNKGDKITTYNILKFLHQDYDIYLGCFIDDPFDDQYRSKVNALCKEVFFMPLSTTYSKIKGVGALLTGKPITLPYYHRAEMQEWVDKTLVQTGIQKAFVYSGCMAQYLHPQHQPLHSVMHFADIDSDKWRQYADKNQGVMRKIYQREHQLLAAYECQIAAAFAVSSFVTESETLTFQQMNPAAISDRIKTLENGLDSEYFSPQAASVLVEDFPLTEQNFIVFTGAMDYWANQDAVVWFVEQAWPQVRAAVPDALFYIVGSSPSEGVKRLSEHPGVVVTGRVEDVRPYLLHAKAAVAPMQIARGVQNKILEALAMAKPVQTSSLGIEGLVGYPSQDIKVTDDPKQSALWAIEKLQQPAYHAVAARQWIEDNFSWQAKLAPLHQFLGGEHASA